MQEAIVALIVAYAAWVVAKRYAPKPVRLFVQIAIVAVAKKIGWNRVVRKFDINAAPLRASGCGTCNGCSTSDAAPVKKQIIITPESLNRTGSR